MVFLVNGDHICKDFENEVGQINSVLVSIPRDCCLFKTHCRVLGLKYTDKSALVPSWFSLENAELPYMSYSGEEQRYYS